MILGAPYELYCAVRQYIDVYNYQRSHQVLDYQKPARLYFGQIEPQKFT